MYSLGKDIGNLNFCFCRNGGRNFQRITECLREQHFSISFRLINFRKSRNKIKFTKRFLSNNRKYQVPSLFGCSGSVKLTVHPMWGRAICNKFTLSYHKCLLIICWWLCKINTHWCYVVSFSYLFQGWENRTPTAYINLV